jgi:NAD(P)-dependent dehydrogenase (short-subunit alcohol dehydrogenase family)
VALDPSVERGDRPSQLSVPPLAVAVVVGGSRGIGLAVGQSLGRAGFRVLLVGRSGEDLARAAAELATAGVDASWFFADLSKAVGATELCRVISQQYGPVPIALIYAAGKFGPIATVSSVSMEEWRSVIETNLLGALYITRLLLPPMLAAGWGRVIYISSKAALGKPGNGASAYTISKIGLNRLALEVAAEVAGRGVTANSIHPGDCHVG